MQALDAIFHPRSLAIIGASNDPVRIGGRPLDHALRYGFEGRVYAVNPVHRTVQGQPAFSSVLDVPGDIDCALLAVPSRLLPQTLRECGVRGVRGAIVFGGGFAEMGAEGAAAQAEIGQIARTHGMRLLGPNCIGSFSLRHRAYLTFLSQVPTTSTVAKDDAHDVSSPARIGLVSQSGGYGGHMLQLAVRRGMAVAEMVTTGNEADIEFGEALAWMAELPDVDILIGYVEGIRSRAGFLRGLEAARRCRKPLILMKVGTTREGAAAAVSHTAALAGADEVYDAVLESYGALRAESAEEVMDIAYALAASKPLGPLRRRKLAVMSVSGGAAVQIADFSSKAGLTLEPAPPQVQRQLREMVPNGSPANPVDITAQIINEPELARRSLDCLLASGYDSVLMWFGPAVKNAHAGGPIVDAVRAASRKYPQALLTVSMFGDSVASEAFEQAGCMLFEEPRRAVHALAALEHFADVFERPLPRPCEEWQGERLAVGASFNEVDAKRLLARIGVRSPVEHLVRTPEEAARTVAALECRVAIKVVSQQIAHKSEAGGVALDVATPAQAAEVVRVMAAEVATKAPHATVDGFLVSPMLVGGVECVLGMHRDPVFGPVMMFGLGGVLVELMQDVAFALAPLDEAAAMALITKVRGHRLLTGFRGRPPADVPALAAAIAAVSRFAVGNADRLHALEINPLCVLPIGQGVVALDAVVQAVRADASQVC